MESQSNPVQNASDLERQFAAFIERYATEALTDPDIDRTAALPAFLAFCATSLTTEADDLQQRAPSDLIHDRDLFIRAGLDALAERHRTDGDWVQIGVRPAEHSEPAGELYGRVAALADRLLSDGAIENFFFMHKPPGLRLRFQMTRNACSRDTRDAISAEVAHWQALELIDRVEPGVYEPESRLFGGPLSMPFVHALFTLDSLLWLEFHDVSLRAGEELSPAWLLSLTLLRTVFAGLEIVGWEDIGVWEQIMTRAGRQLDQDDDALPGYASLRAGFRRLWCEDGRITDLLHPTVRAILERHELALRAGVAQWRAGYFNQPEARIGPRAAAAFYVIFHWNRAALSPMVQALLATALAEREV